jgi:uncharacterized protein
MMNQLIYDNNGKLRSGYRAVGFIALFTVISAMLAAIYMSSLAAFGAAPAPNSKLNFIMNSLIGLIPALAAGWICLRAFERMPFSELGASFSDVWLRNFLLGLGLGAATLVTAVLVAMIGGGLSFEYSGFDVSDIVTSLGTSFAIFALAAAFEEALFRGYLLQTFARAGLAWPAIIVTALLFGLAHMGNPNANAFAAVNTVIAGIWFGVAYLKTRDLWFVWGLHLVWNWMQGAVFGIEVSGLTNIVTAPLLREIDNGPHWLTGQDYGIEAGIACTIALLLSIAVIQMWKKNEEKKLTTENTESTENNKQ